MEEYDDNVTVCCAECGKPITDKVVHSTAYGKKLFCSLNCAANYLGYKRKSEFKE